MKIQKIANKNFILPSKHNITFWTGEILEGDFELADKLKFEDESEVIQKLGEFELINIKKKLSKEGYEILEELNENMEIDFILMPSIFKELDLSYLTPRKKLVIQNVINPEDRGIKANKIASNRLTIIR